jgi:hypothetical protein
VKSCTDFYEKLSAVDGEYEEWRRIVCANPEPHWKFVHANTFLVPHGVELKVYDESNEEIIRSCTEKSEASSSVWYKGLRCDLGSSSIWSNIFKKTVIASSKWNERMPGLESGILDLFNIWQTI